MLVFDTICSLSTPPYKSALAIVRMSGEKSLKILSKITRRDLGKIEPNYAFYTKLLKDKNDEKSLIDECVVVYYKGPNSYTGFDSVDFFLHGNPLICEELLNTLVSLGARRANKGEFSAQGYFNSKFDLLKAEGINDLINANSIRSKNLALHVLQGENTKYINAIKNEILFEISQMEYYIEDQYIENDIEAEKELKNAKFFINKLANEIQIHLDKIKKNNFIYKGVEVGIIGKSNVGKSTLLNALLKKDKAIVSSIPGTTRDIVEGTIEINGIKFTFNDTAGIRETKSKLENLGIKKTFEVIKNSDLLLLLSDTNFSIFNDKKIASIISKKPSIKVKTKNDKKTNKKEEDFDISISALKGDINPLIDLILKKLDLLNIEEGYFLGQREEDYLKRIQKELVDASNSIDQINEIEICSDKLRVVINTINEFLGSGESKTAEDIYETLFANFCLGK